MAYALHGLTKLSELFGDRIVYRNLQPLDRRLPSFEDLVASARSSPPLRRTAQIDPGSSRLPWQPEPAYAQVLVTILRAAQALVRPSIPIQRLLYIGDTRLNDASAFGNLCAAGPWPGLHRTR